jgi:hypothetical protein
LMCMMTSNVFGHIAVQNLGYAHVALEQTIARGIASAASLCSSSDQHRRSRILSDAINALSRAPRLRPAHQL